MKLDPEQQKALNAAATELLRKVDSKTPEEFFKLYNDDSTKEAAVLLEQDLLKAALSKLKLKFLEAKRITLNDQEIKLLVKYTGITFTNTGSMANYQTQAPVVTKNQSPQSLVLLNTLLSVSTAEPFSEEEGTIIKNIFLNNKSKSPKRLTPKESSLFAEYIFACLTLPSPEQIITDYSYQQLSNEDSAQNQLLKKLELIFKQITPETLKAPEILKEKVLEINSIFNELYKYIGIKYQFDPTTGTINVVKIKYNAPAFVEELEKHPELKDAEKHSIYVITKEKQTTLLPKRTNKSQEQGKKPLLGKGAFGVVHESFTIDRDNREVKPIALKKIKINKENIQQIAHEVSILKELGLNPITIRIGNNLYIGIPLFPGKTIEAKDFEEQSLDTKLKVAISLANDLAKIHAKGIWHRDIKGANAITNALYISEEQRLETNIFDFNTSEILSNLGTKPITVEGTPGYIAPEFGGIFPNAQYTENPTKADYLASDIYSLGKLFMYDMGLYNLGIVYKMIDPDYKKRPSIEEVLTVLNTYSANKRDIEKQELVIKNMPSTNSQELNAKILAIDGLLKQHNICSESYYETLIKVLEIGTPEQLKIMMNNPVFHNLYVKTPTGMGTSLSAPYENKIQELLAICTNNTPHAEECAWLILEHLIKLIKEQGLATWTANQHLNNYTTFLVDAGLSLGKFNTDTSDLNLLKQLGITPPTHKQRLESLSESFPQGINETAQDSSSMASSPRTGDSSVGPESPTSTVSTDVLGSEKGSTEKTPKKDGNGKVG